MAHRGRQRRLHPAADDPARLPAPVHRPRGADPAGPRAAPDRVHRHHPARPPAGHTMTRLRIAIHSDLREHGEQAAVYRETLGLFARAEELGFDGAWVRSYKFRRTGGAPGFSFPGGLPSPLVFLGALAARTSRIRLGTAVVPLPLENVVRVVEDAAVLDALSCGRLELGVSSGGGPPISTALGIDLDPDPAAKKAGYLRSLETLVAILDGDPVNGTDQELNPPAGRA